MKKFKAFKYIVFVLIAAAAVAAVMLFTQKKSAEKSGENLVPVVVAGAFRGDLKESVTISGYVEAQVMIPVVPFVQGTITSYSARAGDFVRKDAVLAKIDDAPFYQTLLQAQAAYSAADSTFQRIQSLFNSGATTQQNFDSAKAQRDASKAQYDLAKLQYDYCTVKAPVEGTILIADQGVGSVATSTIPLAVIADLNNQVVRLKVPEKYYDLFVLEQDNLEVSVIRPAEGGMYNDAVTSAKIDNIAPYVSPESKTFQVVCSLDDVGDRFRPGMYVKVNVAYRSYRDVPLLDMNVRKLDGALYIYEPETERVRYVDIGSVASDGEHFVVPEEYGDCLFVVDGQNSVFDGQRVQVVDGSVFYGNTFSGSDF